MNWIEYVGYGGSLIVAISLMMTNICKLRWVNFVGAVVFMVYGFLLDAMPVVALNAFIAFIDLYHLYKIYTEKEYFTMNGNCKKDELSLQNFLQFCAKDMAKFFPGFNMAEIKNPQIVLISRQLNPAGLFIYEEIDAETIKIHVDYARPEFRDAKNGRYIFEENKKMLAKKGHKKIIASASEKSHESYLKKMGFKNIGDYFIKEITL